MTCSSEQHHLDARQGEVVADVLMDKGYKSAAMTYTNNDYGKGLADSIKANFEKAGGKITISAAHEDGKGDYGAEVAALAQAGGDILIVAGYLIRVVKASSSHLWIQARLTCSICQMA